jgi:hypothetical protein
MKELDSGLKKVKYKCKDVLLYYLRMIQSVIIF